MTLYEVRQHIKSSRSDMWNVLPGFPLPDRLRRRTTTSGPEFEADNYDHLAVYMPVVSLSIAWGLTDDDDFTEEWHQNFADKKARGVWLDILWNGAPIDRQAGVVVDGAKCTLPRPKRELEGEATIGWEISGWQHLIFGLVNTLAGVSSVQFEDYVQKAGFFVRE